MSNGEYLRALEILRVEFGPFVVGGISTLDEVLADVDWSKSPGWPYVDQGCSTKREAWDKFSDVILERAYSLMRGEYVECNFIATLKDELVVKGKSTRVFLPSPFHHQIACAFLFKKAADSLTNTCHLHSSAIGLNIFGRGLERSLRRLDQHPYAYDADQSGCDTSCKDPEPERDFMKTGLPSQYHAGVDMLFNLAMCPRVMVEGALLSLVLNPSGWYLTTVFNTLMTHRTIAGAYLDMFPYETILDMRNHLLQTNGGDDLMFSTDKREFDIVYVAHAVARRGMYLETDHLLPRNAMTLTFFSHNLYVRQVGQMYIYVACGRLSKILSAFSFLKTTGGRVDWLRAASRVVGLMMNLWPYKFEFETLYPYLYHMIHHFFLLDGRKLTNEWTGVFRSIPSDESMLVLRNGSTLEGVLFFSPSLSSPESGKGRVLQSALKTDIQTGSFEEDPLSFSSCANFQEVSYSQIQIMSKRNNRRVDAILDSLERQNLLTQCGRDWLISALDPFHDEDLRLDGYPDVMTSSTVVQLIKKTIQLTVPTSGAGTVGAGNNWDCSIALFPNCVNATMAFSTGLSATGSFTTGNSTNSILSGGLVASAGPQGSTLWPNVITNNPTATTTGLDFDEYLRGNLRVIGMAFEVINTTSDLNKQGQVTAWRNPSLWTPSNANTTIATVPPVTLIYPYQYNRWPPSTLADAQLLYGSRSWAAAEGAYVVARQSSSDNPIRQPSWPLKAFVGSDPQSNGNSQLNTHLAITSPSEIADVLLPFDISGVHFTGLSFTTTLTVNVRWLVERVPGPTETDLVVLATPSAPYDPLALELYCQCLRSMPPGVMLSENPLGEWFRSAISKVADSIPMLARGISAVAPMAGVALNSVLPGAAGVGSAIGSVANSVASLYKQPLPGSSSSTNRKDIAVERPKGLSRVRKIKRKKVVAMKRAQ